MKKIFSIALVLLAITTMQAAVTEAVRIAVTGQGGTEASYVILRVDPAISADETASFVGVLDEIGQLNIYAVKGTEKLSTIKSSAFADLELQVVTNRRPAANQHYTLTFNVPTITDGLSLYDRKTGVTTDITNGGTYEFDVNTTLHPDYVEGANYTIVDRFIINYTPAPVAKSFCFRNNILEINGYKDDANVKIDDAAVAITSDNFTREFTAAEAGRHKLTIDGKDYLFDAFPSNVTPVVP